MICLIFNSSFFSIISLPFTTGNKASFHA
jgi:hypothetical protein